jgi:hypothetical protein
MVAFGAPARFGDIDPRYKPDVGSPEPVFGRLVLVLRTTRSAAFPSGAVRLALRPDGRFFFAGYGAAPGARPS